jgi:diaminohydroxyphosphoribosylaminopyrimidine deaminase / 5-amino-6-(5-phosphoribosylamino)uracil reductase
VRNNFSDEFFMGRALIEARKSIGQTSPNPAVGAVLVANKKIIARGHHRGAGLPHGEIECLQNLSGKIPRNASLYVTLEPCSTAGRTPPCTDAIIRAGVKRVVIGAIDINPIHAGRAIDYLRTAGVDVTSGVLSDECTRLNEAFNKWIVTRRPFVIAKCGMSLDGRLTRRPGEPRSITSPAARQHAQQLRALVDAILIGAETLRQDNPRLTVRGVPEAKQPWRVVITRSRKLPPGAHLFTDRFAHRTLIYRHKSLDSVLRDLGRKEITSVLIEGGGAVLGQFFDQRLADKIQFYVAPILSGGLVLAVPGTGADKTANSIRLGDIRFQRIGLDISVAGYPIYPPK